MSRVQIRGGPNLIQRRASSAVAIPRHFYLEWRLRLNYGKYNSERVPVQPEACYHKLYNQNTGGNILIWKDTRPGR